MEGVNWYTYKSSAFILIQLLLQGLKFKLIQPPKVSGVNWYFHNFLL